jgi:cell wall-associated NlpC family hydrolase
MTGWLSRYAHEYVAGVYDCWSLVRDVYRRELGIELPVVTVTAYDLRTILAEFASTPIKSLFERISHPEHLCVVEMANRRTGMHVGVYLDTPDGARVLHNIAGSGVVCEPLDTVNRTLVFWRYHG